MTAKTSRMTPKDPRTNRKNHPTRDREIPDIIWKHQLHVKHKTFPFLTEVRTIVDLYDRRYLHALITSCNWTYAGSSSLKTSADILDSNSEGNIYKFNPIQITQIRWYAANTISNTHTHTQTKERAYSRLILFFQVLMAAWRRSVNIWT